MRHDLASNTFTGETILSRRKTSDLFFCHVSHKKNLREKLISVQPIASQKHLENAGRKEVEAS